MITDDMIRDALHRIADIAPSGVRVQAALARRTRWRRHRRALVLAGGVTAAVAAVAGPAALVLRERPVRIEAGAANLPEPQTPPAPAGENTFVALRWRPTWLPEGYVEVSRTVTVEGSATGLQVRTWRLPRGEAGHDGAERLIHLHAAPPAWFGDQSWRQPATVNGAPGGLARDSGQVSQVVWRPNPGEMLAVGVTEPGPDAIEVAQRIAGSVVVDGVAGCELPLGFGWLPQVFVGAQVATVDTDERDDPRVELRLEPSGGAMGAMPMIRAVLGTSVDYPAGGEPVTVRGREGVGWVVLPTGVEPGELVVASGLSGWVRVELDDGRQLFVWLEQHEIADPPSVLDDLVRVADSLRIGPVPDISWLGRR